MTITLTRHALSVFNKYNTQDLDCVITNEGMSQCTSLSGDYDLVILSPLIRTRQTLEYSLIHPKLIVVSQLCREKRDSPCDYLRGEDVVKETEDSVIKRVKDFKKELFEYSKKYKDILIISHGIFGWYLSGKCLRNCETMDISHTIESLCLREYPND